MKKPKKSKKLTNLTMGLGAGATMVGLVSATIGITETKDNRSSGKVIAHNTSTVLQANTHNTKVLPSDNQLARLGITTVAQDDKGGFFVGGKNGLFEHFDSSGKLSTLDTPKDKITFDINAIALDGLGGIIISGSKAAQVHIDANGNKLKDSFSLDADSKSQAAISKSLTSKDGKIYAAGTHGLVTVFDSKGSKLQNIRLGQDAKIKVMIETDDSIVLGSEQGTIFFVDKITGNVSLVKVKSPVVAIQDNEGGVFVQTETTSLEVSKTKGVLTSQTLEVFDNAEITNMVSTKDGYVVTGTNGNIALLDKKLQVVSKSIVLQGFDINAIIPDGKDGFFIAGQKGLISHVDSKGKENSKEIKTILDGSDIYGMQRNDQGHIFVFGDSFKVEEINDLGQSIKHFNVLGVSAINTAASAADGKVVFGGETKSTQVWDTRIKAMPASKPQLAKTPAVAIFGSKVNPASPAPVSDPTIQHLVTKNSPAPGIVGGSTHRGMFHASASGTAAGINGNPPDTDTTTPTGPKPGVIIYHRPAVVTQTPTTPTTPQTPTTPTTPQAPTTPTTQAPTTPTTQTPTTQTPTTQQTAHKPGVVGGKIPGAIGGNFHVGPAGVAVVASSGGPQTLLTAFKAPQPAVVGGKAHVTAASMAATHKDALVLNQNPGEFTADWMVNKNHESTRTPTQEMNDNVKHHFRDHWSHVAGTSIYVYDDGMSRFLWKTYDDEGSIYCQTYWNGTLKRAVFITGFKSTISLADHLVQADDQLIASDALAEFSIPRTNHGTKFMKAGFKRDTDANNPNGFIFENSNFKITYKPNDAQGIISLTIYDKSALTTTTKDIPGFLKISDFASTFKSHTEYDLQQLYTKLGFVSSEWTSASFTAYMEAMARRKVFSVVIPINDNYAITAAISYIVKDDSTLSCTFSNLILATRENTNLPNENLDINTLLSASDLASIRVSIDSFAPKKPYASAEMASIISNFHDGGINLVQDANDKNTYTFSDTNAKITFTVDDSAGTINAVISGPGQADSTLSFTGFVVKIPNFDSMLTHQKIQDALNVLYASLGIESDKWDASLFELYTDFMNQADPFTLTIPLTAGYEAKAKVVFTPQPTAAGYISCSLTDWTIENPANGSHLDASKISTTPFMISPGDFAEKIGTASEEMSQRFLQQLHEKSIYDHDPKGAPNIFTNILNGVTLTITVDDPTGTIDYKIEQAGKPTIQKQITGFYSMNNLGMPTVDPTLLASDALDDWANPADSSKTRTLKPGFRKDPNPKNPYGFIFSTPDNEIIYTPDNEHMTITAEIHAKNTNTVLTKTISGFYNPTDLVSELSQLDQTALKTIATNLYKTLGINEGAWNIDLFNALMAHVDKETPFTILIQPKNAHYKISAALTFKLKDPTTLTYTISDFTIVNPEDKISSSKNSIYFDLLQKTPKGQAFMSKHETGEITVGKFKGEWLSDQEQNSKPGGTNSGVKDIYTFLKTTGWFPTDGTFDATSGEMVWSGHGGGTYNGMSDLIKYSFSFKSADSTRPNAPLTGELDITAWIPNPDGTKIILGTRKLTGFLNSKDIKESLVGEPTLLPTNNPWANQIDTAIRAMDFTGLTKGSFNSQHKEITTKVQVGKTNFWLEVTVSLEAITVDKIKFTTKPDYKIFWKDPKTNVEHELKRSDMANPNLFDPDVLAPETGAEVRILKTNNKMLTDYEAGSRAKYAFGQWCDAQWQDMIGTHSDNPAIDTAESATSQLQAILAYHMTPAPADPKDSHYINDFTWINNNKEWSSKPGANAWVADDAKGTITFTTVFTNAKTGISYTLTHVFTGFSIYKPIFDTLNADANKAVTISDSIVKALKSLSPSWVGDNALPSELSSLLTSNNMKLEIGSTIFDVIFREKSHDDSTGELILEAYFNDPGVTTTDNARKIEFTVNPKTIAADGKSSLLTDLIDRANSCPVSDIEAAVNAEIAKYNSMDGSSKPTQLPSEALINGFKKTFTIAKGPINFDVYVTYTPNDATGKINWKVDKIDNNGFLSNKLPAAEDSTAQFMTEQEFQDAFMDKKTIADWANDHILNGLDTNLLASKAVLNIDPKDKKHTFTINGKSYDADYTFTGDDNTGKIVIEVNHNGSKFIVATDVEAQSKETFQTTTSEKRNRFIKEIKSKLNEAEFKKWLLDNKGANPAALTTFLETTKGVFAPAGSLSPADITWLKANLGGLKIPQGSFQYSIDDVTGKITYRLILSTNPSNVINQIFDLTKDANGNPDATYLASLTKITTNDIFKTTNLNTKLAVVDQLFPDVVYLKGEKIELKWVYKDPITVVMHYISPTTGSEVHQEYKFAAPTSNKLPETITGFMTKTYEGDIAKATPQSASDYINNHLGEKAKVDFGSQLGSILDIAQLGTANVVDTATADFLKTITDNTEFLPLGGNKYFVVIHGVSKVSTGIISIDGDGKMKLDRQAVDDKNDDSVSYAVIDSTHILVITSDGISIDDISGTTTKTTPILKITKSISASGRIFKTSENTYVYVDDGSAFKLTLLNDDTKAIIEDADTGPASLSSFGKITGHLILGSKLIVFFDGGYYAFDQDTTWGLTLKKQNPTTIFKLVVPGSDNKILAISPVGTAIVCSFDPTTFEVTPETTPTDLKLSLSHPKYISDLGEGHYLVIDQDGSTEGILWDNDGTLTAGETTSSIFANTQGTAHAILSAPGVTNIIGDKQVFGFKFSRMAFKDLPITFTANDETGEVSWTVGKTTGTFKSKLPRFDQLITQARINALMDKALPISTRSNAPSSKVKLPKTLTFTDPATGTGITPAKPITIDLTWTVDPINAEATCIATHSQADPKDPSKTITKTLPPQKITGFSKLNITAAKIEAAMVKQGWSPDPTLTLSEQMLPNTVDVDGVLISIVWSWDESTNEMTWTASLPGYQFVTTGTYTCASFKDRRGVAITDSTLNGLVADSLKKDDTKLPSEVIKILGSPNGNYNPTITTTKIGVGSAASNNDFTTTSNYVRLAQGVVIGTKQGLVYIKTDGTQITASIVKSGDFYASSLTLLPNNKVIAFCDGKAIVTDGTVAGTKTLAFSGTTVSDLTGASIAQIHSDIYYLFTKNGIYEAKFDSSASTLTVGTHIVAKGDYSGATLRQQTKTGPSIQGTNNIIVASASGVDIFDTTNPDSPIHSHLSPTEELSFANIETTQNGKYLVSKGTHSYIVDLVSKSIKDLTTSPTPSTLYRFGDTFAYLDKSGIHTIDGANIKVTGVGAPSFASGSLIQMPIASLGGTGAIFIELTSAGIFSSQVGILDLQPPLYYGDGQTTDDVTVTYTPDNEAGTITVTTTLKEDPTKTATKIISGYQKDEDALSLSDVQDAVNKLLGTPDNTKLSEEVIKTLPKTIQVPLSRDPNATLTIAITWGYDNVNGRVTWTASVKNRSATAPKLSGNNSGYQKLMGRFNEQDLRDALEKIFNSQKGKLPSDVISGLQASYDFSLATSGVTTDTVKVFLTYTPSDIAGEITVNAEYQSGLVEKPFTAFNDNDKLNKFVGFKNLDSEVTQAEIKKAVEAAVKATGSSTVFEQGTNELPKEVYVIKNGYPIKVLVHYTFTNKNVEYEAYIPSGITGQQATNKVTGYLDDAASAALNKQVLADRLKSRITAALAAQHKDGGGVLPSLLQASIPEVEMGTEFTLTDGGSSLGDLSGYMSKTINGKYTIIYKGNVLNVIDTSISRISQGSDITLSGEIINTFAFGENKLIVIEAPDSTDTNHPNTAVHIQIIDMSKSNPTPVDIYIPSIASEVIEKSGTNPWSEIKQLDTSRYIWKDKTGIIHFFWIDAKTGKFIVNKDIQFAKSVTQQSDLEKMDLSTLHALPNGNFIVSANGKLFELSFDTNVVSVVASSILPTDTKFVEIGQNKFLVQDGTDMYISGYTQGSGFNTSNKVAALDLDMNHIVRINGRYLVAKASDGTLYKIGDTTPTTTKLTPPTAATSDNVLISIGHRKAIYPTASSAGIIEAPSDGFANTLLKVTTTPDDFAGTITYTVTLGKTPISFVSNQGVKNGKPVPYLTKSPIIQEANTLVTASGDTHKLTLTENIPPSSHFHLEYKLAADKTWKTKDDFIADLSKATTDQDLSTLQVKYVANDGYVISNKNTPNVDVSNVKPYVHVEEQQAVLAGITITGTTESASLENIDPKLFGAKLHALGLKLMISFGEIVKGGTRTWTEVDTTKDTYVLPKTAFANIHDHSKLGVEFKLMQLDANHVIDKTIIKDQPMTDYSNIKVILTPVNPERAAVSANGESAGKISLQEYMDDPKNAGQTLKALPTGGDNDKIEIQYSFTTGRTPDDALLTSLFPGLTLDQRTKLQDVLKDWFTKDYFDKTIAPILVTENMNLDLGAALARFAPSSSIKDGPENYIINHKDINPFQINNGIVIYHDLHVVKDNGKTVDYYELLDNLKNGISGTLANIIIKLPPELMPDALASVGKYFSVKTGTTNTLGPDATFGLVLEYTTIDNPTENDWTVVNSGATGNVNGNSLAIGTAPDPKRPYLFFRFRPVQITNGKLDFNSIFTSTDRTLEKNPTNSKVIPIQSSNPVAIDLMNTKFNLKVDNAELTKLIFVGDLRHLNIDGHNVAKPSLQTIVTDSQGIHHTLLATSEVLYQFITKDGKIKSDFLNKDDFCKLLASLETPSVDAKYKNVKYEDIDMANFKVKYDIDPTSQGASRFQILLPAGVNPEVTISLVKKVGQEINLDDIMKQLQGLKWVGNNHELDVAVDGSTVKNPIIPQLEKIIQALKLKGFKLQIAQTPRVKPTAPATKWDYAPITGTPTWVDLADTNGHVVWPTNIGMDEGFALQIVSISTTDTLIPFVSTENPDWEIGAVKTLTPQATSKNTNPLETDVTSMLKYVEFNLGNLTKAVLEGTMHGLTETTLDDVMKNVPGWTPVIAQEVDIRFDMKGDVYTYAELKAALQTGKKKDGSAIEYWNIDKADIKIYAISKPGFALKNLDVKHNGYSSSTTHTLYSPTKTNLKNYRVGLEKDIKDLIEKITLANGANTLAAEIDLPAELTMKLLQDHGLKLQYAVGTGTATTITSPTWMDITGPKTPITGIDKTNKLILFKLVPDSHTILDKTTELPSPAIKKDDIKIWIDNSGYDLAQMAIEGDSLVPSMDKAKFVAAVFAKDATSDIKATESHFDVHVTLSDWKTPTLALANGLGFSTLTDATKAGLKGDMTLDEFNKLFESKTTNLYDAKHTTTHEMLTIKLKMVAQAGYELEGAHEVTVDTSALTRITDITDIIKDLRTKLTGDKTPGISISGDSGNLELTLPASLDPTALKALHLQLQYTAEIVDRSKDTPANGIYATVHNGLKESGWKTLSTPGVKQVVQNLDPKTKSLTFRIVPLDANFDGTTVSPLYQTNIWSGTTETLFTYGGNKAPNPIQIDTTKVKSLIQVNNEWLKHIQFSATKTQLLSSRYFTLSNFETSPVTVVAGQTPTVGQKTIIEVTENGETYKLNIVYQIKQGTKVSKELTEAELEAALALGTVQDANGNDIKIDFTNYKLFAKYNTVEVGGKVDALKEPSNTDWTELTGVPQKWIERQEYDDAIKALAPTGDTLDIDWHIDSKNILSADNLLASGLKIQWSTDAGKTWHDGLKQSYQGDLFSVVNNRTLSIRVIPMTDAEAATAQNKIKDAHLSTFALPTDKTNSLNNEVKEDVSASLASLNITLDLKAGDLAGLGQFIHGTTFDVASIDESSIDTNDPDSPTSKAHIEYKYNGNWYTKADLLTQLAKARVASGIWTDAPDFGVNDVTVKWVLDDPLNDMLPKDKTGFIISVEQHITVTQNLQHYVDVSKYISNPKTNTPTMKPDALVLSGEINHGEFTLGTLLKLPTGFKDLKSYLASLGIKLQWTTLAKPSENIDVDAKGVPVSAADPTAGWQDIADGVFKTLDGQIDGDARNFFVRFVPLNSNYLLSSVNHVGNKLVAKALKLDASKLQYGISVNTDQLQKIIFSGNTHALTIDERAALLHHKVIDPTSAFKTADAALVQISYRATSLRSFTRMENGKSVTYKAGDVVTFINATAFQDAVKAGFDFVTTTLQVRYTAINSQTDKVYDSKISDEDKMWVNAPVITGLKQLVRTETIGTLDKTLITVTGNNVKFTVAFSKAEQDLLDALTSKGLKVQYSISKTGPWTDAYPAKLGDSKDLYMRIAPINPKVTSITYDAASSPDKKDYDGSQIIKLDTSKLKVAVVLSDQDLAALQGMSFAGDAEFHTGMLQGLPTLPTSTSDNKVHAEFRYKVIERDPTGTSHTFSTTLEGAMQVDPTTGSKNKAFNKDRDKELEVEIVIVDKDKNTYQLTDANGNVISGDQTKTHAKISTDDLVQTISGVIVNAQSFGAKLVDPKTTPLSWIEWVKNNFKPVFHQGASTASGLITGSLVGLTKDGKDVDTASTKTEAQHDAFHLGENPFVQNDWIDRDQINALAPRHTHFMFQTRTLPGTPWSAPSATLQNLPTSTSFKGVRVILQADAGYKLDDFQNELKDWHQDFNLVLVAKTDSIGIEHIKFSGFDSKGRIAQLDPALEFTDLDFALKQIGMRNPLTTSSQFIIEYNIFGSDGNERLWTDSDGVSAKGWHSLPTDPSAKSSFYGKPPVDLKNGDQVKIRLRPINGFIINDPKSQVKPDTVGYWHVSHVIDAGVVSGMTHVITLDDALAFDQDGKGAAGHPTFKLTGYDQQGKLTINQDQMGAEKDNVETLVQWLRPTPQADGSVAIDLENNMQTISGYQMYVGKDANGKPVWKDVAKMVKGVLTWTTVDHNDIKGSWVKPSEVTKLSVGDRLRFRFKAVNPKSGSYENGFEWEDPKTTKPDIQTPKDMSKLVYTGSSVPAANQDDFGVFVTGLFINPNFKHSDAKISTKKVGTHLRAYNGSAILVNAINPKADEKWMWQYTVMAADGSTIGVYDANHAMPNNIIKNGVKIIMKVVPTSSKYIIDPAFNNKFNPIEISGLLSEIDAAHIARPELVFGGENGKGTVAALVQGDLMPGSTGLKETFGPADPKTHSFAPSTTTHGLKWVYYVSDVDPTTLSQTELDALVRYDSLEPSTTTTDGKIPSLKNGMYIKMVLAPIDPTKNGIEPVVDSMVGPKQIASKLGDGSWIKVQGLYVDPSIVHLEHHVSGSIQLPHLDASLKVPSAEAEDIRLEVRVQKGGQGSWSAWGDSKSVQTIENGDKLEYRAVLTNGASPDPSFQNAGYTDPTGSFVTSTENGVAITAFTKPAWRNIVVSGLLDAIDVENVEFTNNGIVNDFGSNVPGSIANTFRNIDFSKYVVNGHGKFNGCSLTSQMESFIKMMKDEKSSGLAEVKIQYSFFKYDSAHDAYAQAVVTDKPPSSGLSNGDKIVVELVLVHPDKYVLSSPVKLTLIISDLLVMVNSPAKIPGIKFDGKNGQGEVKVASPALSGQKWEYRVYDSNGNPLPDVTYLDGTKSADGWTDKKPTHLQNYQFVEVRNFVDDKFIHTLPDNLFTYSGKKLVSGLAEEMNLGNIKIDPTNFRVESDGPGSAHLVATGLPDAAKDTKYIYQVLERNEDGTISLIDGSTSDTLPDHLKNGEIVRVTLVSTKTQNSALQGPSIDVEVDGVSNAKATKSKATLWIGIGSGVAVALTGGLALLFKKYRIKMK